MFDRRRALGAGALGIAGMLSAIVLAALASNQIKTLGSVETTQFLLIIQWHLLGFTICKFGVDYASFAVLSKRQDITLSITALLKFPTIPLSAVYFAATAVQFTFAIAVLLWVAVVLDALATFRAAELNAREHWNLVAIGNLLNYPVCLLLLLTYSIYQNPPLQTYVACFALSSLTRYLWLERKYRTSNFGSKRSVNVKNVPMTGLQGLANWGLFKGDQFVIAFLSGYAVFNWMSVEASRYVFLARIPEIATGVLVLLGSVYFPKYHLAKTQSYSMNADVIRRYALVGMAIFVFFVCLAYFALPMFNGQEITYQLAVPFVIQVPLILWANMATYSMQSAGHLPALIRNECIATFSGLLLCGLAIANRSLELLAWSIPFQLSIFILLGTYTNWGRKIETHE